MSCSSTIAHLYIILYLFTCLLVSAQNYGYHIDGHGHIRAREQTMILGKFSHSKIIRMTIHIATSPSTITTSITVIVISIADES